MKTRSKPTPLITDAQWASLHQSAADIMVVASNVADSAYRRSLNGIAKLAKAAAKAGLKGTK